MIITGGTSYLLTPSTQPTLIVMLDHAIEFPPALYELGVCGITLPYQRHFPEAKTTNYLTAVRYLTSNKEAAGKELIYVDEKGVVLEGAVSNVFAVIGGEAVTPDNRVLEGITKGILLECLPNRTSKSTITFAQLAAAPEVFISTTGKGVVPVVQIDGVAVGNGKVGPVTKACMAAFNDFVASDKW